MAGEDVTVVQIEVVAGPVEVRWYRAYVRQAVLSADRDELCDACEFSCGEALARLFKRSGKERILANWLLGEFGIGATRAEEGERSTPLATALSNKLSWIRRLSEMNSAGRLALAAIPPTRAAAAIAISGRTFLKKAAVV